jgi:hypothetical protein
VTINERGRAPRCLAALFFVAASTAAAGCGNIYTKQNVYSYVVDGPAAACAPREQAAESLEGPTRNSDRDGLDPNLLLDWWVDEGPAASPAYEAEAGLPPESWTTTCCSYLVTEKLKAGLILTPDLAGPGLWPSLFASLYR